MTFHIFFEILVSAPDPVIRYRRSLLLLAFTRLVACLSAQINVADRKLTGVDVVVKAA